MENLIELELLSAYEVKHNIRLTIHLNGRLGFNAHAISSLGIKIGNGIKIMRNLKDPAGENLYCRIIPNQDDLTAFNISKAGQYYTANTRDLWDALGFDYLSRSIHFDLSKVTINGETYYKMKQGERKARKTRSTISKTS
jgi:hypothetical protein